MKTNNVQPIPLTVLLQISVSMRTALAMPETVANTVQRLIDTGLSDAVQTLEDGEGDLDSAQFATDLQIGQPVVVSSNAHAALSDLVGVLLRADKDNAIDRAIDNEGITDSYGDALTRSLQCLGDDGLIDVARRYELDVGALRSKAGLPAQVPDAHEITPPWAPEHQEAAAREGWDIWDTGPSRARWRLMRIDSVEDFADDNGLQPPQLKDDLTAYRIVANGTAGHHVAARAFLRAHHPEEYEQVMREADPVKLAEHDIPAFRPRIENRDGLGVFYSDGRVEGAVDVSDAADGKSITISEWSCFFRNRGFTRTALQWLRSQGYIRIVANGVGTLDLVDGVLTGDIATGYWAHMHRVGLVDLLLDDDGRALSVDANEAVTYASPNQ